MPRTASQPGSLIHPPLRQPPAAQTGNLGNATINGQHQLLPLHHHPAHHARCPVHPLPLQSPVVNLHTMVQLRPLKIIRQATGAPTALPPSQVSPLHTAVSSDSSKEHVSTQSTKSSPWHVEATFTFDAHASTTHRHLSQTIKAHLVSRISLTAAMAAPILKPVNFATWTYSVTRQLLCGQSSSANSSSCLRSLPSVKYLYPLRPLLIFAALITSSYSTFTQAPIMSFSSRALLFRHSANSPCPTFASVPCAFPWLRRHQSSPIPPTRYRLAFPHSTFHLALPLPGGTRYSHVASPRH